MIPDNREGRATGTAYRLELTIVDNLRRSVVIQSDSYRVANESPIITSITLPEMINEGDTQTISVSVSDPNYDDLMYRWNGDDSDVLSNETSKSAVLSIPPYYIKDAASTQTTLNLEVEVSDGDISTSETLSVVVNKQNNSSATLETSIEIAIRGTTLTAMILFGDPDGGTSGTVVYRWQVCAGAEGRCPSANDWMNIDEATGTQYITSGADILVEGGSTFPVVENGSIFRVEGTYIDGQGYREEVYSLGYSYVRLNAAPTISGIPSQRIRLLEGTETKFDVVLNDANPDDISSDLMFSIKSDRLEVARLSVEGENTTRTIRITGIGVGITTITATVNDGRDVSNSEVSKQFEVEVEGNEAPMLEVIAYPQQTIGLGNTTQVMVLITDNNFDVGDSVVLKAMSSSQTMVPVIPMQTNPIATDTIITFTLTGVKGGMATIVFTATDSKGSTSNVSLLVRVYTQPTGSVHIEPDSSDKWLLRSTSTIEDANGIAEVNYQWYRNGDPIEDATTLTYMIPSNRLGRVSGTSYSLELTVMNNIGEMVVLRSNAIMIANEVPVITTITASEMISEGDTQNIRVQASDTNYENLTYRWSGDSGILNNETSKSVTISIPPYYIKDVASTRTILNLKVEVSDGELSTTETVLVVVEKQNNGSARLGTSLEMAGRGTTLTAMILSEDPDGGTSGTVVYQWQVCAGAEGRCPSANDWMDIDGATGEQYMILVSDILVEGGSTFSLVEDGSIFRIEGTYTDGQGYKEEVYSPGRVYTMVLRIRVKVFLEGSLQ